MTKKKIKELEQRVDQITRRPEEEKAYREGFLAGQAEWSRFYSNLPYIFQQTIDEYLFRSPERYYVGSGDSYPKTKEEAKIWFAAAIQKETELHANLGGFLRGGKGNTVYKCPNCDAEYFSGLLMAFHMFDNHAIQTQTQ